MPKQTMNSATTASTTATRNTASNIQNNATTLTNIEQHGAPKPPKKCYLVNSQTMLASNDLQQQETKYNQTEPMMTNDTIVPIFFDKVTLDRIIEHALSDSKSSNSSPSSALYNDDLVSNINLDQSNSQHAITNSLNFPLLNNSRNTNETASTHLGVNVIGTADLSMARKQSIDEPVDFSMNRTYEATNQKIINNLIDRMLSDSRDSTSSLTNSISQPMDQDPQPNQQRMQQSSSTITSNGTKSATNNSSFTSNSSLIEDFDLERKLTELPLFELTNGKFERVDQRQDDGLATLAEAAVAIQQLPRHHIQHQHQQKHNLQTNNVLRGYPTVCLAMTSD